MKFDRNTVIGFVVLAVLFFGYFFYINKEQASTRKEQARLDSIANASKPKGDTAAQRIDAKKADSVTEQINAGTYALAKGPEQLVYAENEVLRIAFTTKGGQPKWVELKKFKNKDSGYVRLAASAFDRISYPIKTGDQRSEETANLNFNKIDSATNADGSKTLSFTLASADSGTAASIVHRFTIKPNEYMVDFDIQFNGGEKLLTNGDLNLDWQYAAHQQESDISFEKQNTQVGYVEDGEFDYHTIGRKSEIDFSKSVKWIGVRQRFFNSFLISKENFSSGKISWTIPADEKQVIVEATTSMKIKVPASYKVGFNLFYGPADIHLLKKYDLKLDKLINLGQGMYAFVRPLNRYVIMPVWDFFKSFVGSFGLVIALLTLIIRLVISPLTYKSYLSGAKMKALRPEIAKLKEKFGADQQAISMEQMKLFREAGVNPLGGCIPALLQIPIFFALYSFFSSNVDLRGADFLWAKDLSAFDDVIKFGVSIPLLGSHLSIFTLTAVLTSLLISIYSMSMTPDQSNPVLKYMPYIFPVFLLFIFNRLPSALTWYYTVSNLVTLILQFVIQNYIIDHNKILVQISENRKKPKAKSKWAERMEQMQEQQKKMKELQQKGKK
ncbi:MAG TPA: membrane protein insertase YidC [Chitinophagaceae bacterium]|nr:membrane protein insertase YidC [Chitinophagaceae bacterium]